MDLSISELGSLGELLSGIAVVISLIYLAVQVRESNELARFESHAKARSLIAEHQKLLTDADGAKIWLKGLEEPELLSREERLRFSNIMYILLNSIELTYLNPSGSYGSDMTIAANLGQYPGFRRWWLQARGNYDRGMMVKIDEALEPHMKDA